MLGRLEMKFGVQSVHSALLPMEYVQVKQRGGMFFIRTCAAFTKV